MSIFDLYESAQTNPEPGSWWIDPATGDYYQANGRGYFEMIFAGKDGQHESKSYKFAERTDLVPYVPGEADYITEDQYIDMSIFAESNGHNLTWLLNRLQANGVNLNEHEELPGVYTPDPVPRVVRDKIVAQLEAEQVQPLTWSRALKAASDKGIAGGLSDIVIRAHFQPIITEHGKTQKAIDAINERIYKLLAQESEPKQLPATVCNEDGEVLNIDDIVEALGLDTYGLKKLGLLKVEEFQINDDASANWFVSRVRALQHKCEAIAEMAGLAIGENLRHIEGMLWRYGPELKAHSESQLKLKKDGTYRSKNVKYLEGAVFFRKGGGWSISDYAELQAWADSLPNYQHKYREALEKILELSEGGIEKIAREALAWESPIDQYPISIVRKVDKRKILKLAEEGVKIPGVTKSPVNELSVMSIGGKRAWSIKKLKESLVLNTDKYKLLTVADDDGETVDVEISDVEAVNPNE